MELELEKEFTCCSLLLLWRETVLKVVFLCPLHWSPLKMKESSIFCFILFYSKVVGFPTLPLLVRTQVSTISHTE